MSVSVKAFLAIERSLADKLVKGWAKISRPLLWEIWNSLRQGNKAKAVELANSIDLDPIVTANAGYGGYFSNAALLFGATRVTRDPRLTQIARGKHEHVIRNALTLLRRAVVNNVEEAIRRALLTKIAEWDTVNLVTHFGPRDDEALAVVGDVPRVRKANLGEYVEPFVSFQGDIFSTGENLLQLTSALHTSRLSAFGFTVEADVRGLTQYRISAQLDKRTCPVCATLDGRVFDVSDAASLLRDALGADNPDDLKNIQPWPPQDRRSVEEIASLSDDELVERGWNVPPFHPWCRCILTPVGEGAGTEQTPSAIAARSVDEPIDQELIADQTPFTDRVLSTIRGERLAEMARPLASRTLTEINYAREAMAGAAGAKAADIWRDLKRQGYTTEELEAIFDITESEVLAGIATFE
jgi:hypothetical protein